MVANELGLERVRAAADRALFLAGMGEESTGATAGVSFAATLVERISQMRQREGVDLSVQVGLSTGPVATGVLHSGAMTFSAWGEPVRRALAIVSLAGRDEVLVDESTRIEAEAAFGFEAATEVIGIDGEPMGLARLSEA
jgi:class 3 adenylate cyclase